MVREFGAYHERSIFVTASGLGVHARRGEEEETFPRLLAQVALEDRDVRANRVEGTPAEICRDADRVDDVSGLRRQRRIARRGLNVVTVGPQSGDEMAADVSAGAEDREPHEL